MRNSKSFAYLFLAAFLLSGMESHASGGLKKKIPAEKNKTVAGAGSNSLSYVRDTLDMSRTSRSSFLSLQQFLKGNATGTYIKETTGEPGVWQGMFIRGLNTPILSNKDIAGTQPTVFLNGIPLLTDNSFLYNIKNNTLNPIGTNNNLLAGLNMNSVESIEVVKDPLRLAMLGPLAANGAILVNLKNRYLGGNHVFVHASGGVSLAPTDIVMTNAGNERNFRMQFADLCNTPQQRADYLQQMPAYMNDIRDVYYFGKPGWADEYFNKVASVYNMGVSIGGGGTRADYIFMLGYTGVDGVADNTNAGKFNASIALNVEPVKGLLMNVLLNGTRFDRGRNRNLRDRYAEAEYLPDLLSPLSPVQENYAGYLNYEKEYKKSENLTNLLNGYLGAKYNLKGVLLNTVMQLDYSADVQRSFWPSGLMESVSFVSNFSGYNRRIRWNSAAGYDWQIDSDNLLGVELEGGIQSDVQHYNYSKAYDGVDDTKPTTSGGSFQSIIRYIDKMQNNLVDMSAHLKYRYKNILQATALFRYDGVSNMQKHNRWFFSPAVGVNWNVKNTFFLSSSILNDWGVSVSWARIGRFLNENRYGAGPQYTGEELSWAGSGTMSSYYGYAGVARPYNSGWIGYNIGWPYSDKLDVSMKASLWGNRLSAELSYYNNEECDLITRIPITQEYGYKYRYANGMNVRNTGVELGLTGKLFSNPKGFNWDISGSVAYNKNKITKLPEGYGKLIYGNRKLQVGESADRFWIYQNAGIYGSDEEVSSQTGTKLSMNGIGFQKGDPKWKDMNGDNVISEADKVLTGHMLPPITGSFSTMLKYKRFDLAADFFFAVGHHALNYRSSQRYNFLTLENRPSLESIKEIFFWQSTHDNNSYPLYNLMSGLEPYRAEQDLFLEKLNYMKLRTLTLGYTLPIKKRAISGKKASKKKDKGETSKNFSLDNIYFYVTGNNLFTLTSFTGDDPELVDYDGYYRGYGHPLSRSVILGLKLNF